MPVVSQDENKTEFPGKSAEYEYRKSFRILPVHKYCGPERMYNETRTAQTIVIIF